MTTTSLPPFLNRWQSAGGAERANYQLFLSELCDLLAVPRPDPTVPDNSKNNYVFDRLISAPNPDGSSSPNFIDLYKRNHFVLETKQGVTARDPAPTALPTTQHSALSPQHSKKGHGIRGTKLWDDALLRAKSQAEAYVRNIPDDNPPFLLVVDVGYSIETYSDFSGLGKTYTPFPDNLSHRFKLTDLADPTAGPALLDRLQKIFTDPHALNPARRTAKVTRQIADHLAALSKSLEASEHPPEAVAHFLMRVLFTLFAEDVGLIPNNAFTKLLIDLEETPQKFAPMAQAVWQNMDKGGFSPVLREDLLRFNGGLFADTQALPLTGKQLALLIEAAKQDWADVEPAIFGTLLERALHPTERHKLGAHYTPRAYVERLVLPTVIEPLRDQWQTAKTKAIAAANKSTPAGLKTALKTAGDFLKTLCNTTVLDPACGSGNFLYVTMEHMKRLEGEVHDFLKLFPNTQLPLEYTGLTVDPHQLRGIEINPRAAAITDLVLWIGYLQWHFRTHGHTMPQEPVLKKFDNIECRDAVLAYDKKELARDEHGKPITHWDGQTYRENATTGASVPDLSARMADYNYITPRRTGWENKDGLVADYIVGNPPFIGKSFLIDALGENYVVALREAYNGVPDSADFVMYWWHNAAHYVANGQAKAFGFITTSSITQKFNRRVVAAALSAQRPIYLAYAIPDHPWTLVETGAAVRIAMSVARSGKGKGILATVTRECRGDDPEAPNLEFRQDSGSILADLSMGPDVVGTQGLLANAKLTTNGVMLGGRGFLVDPNSRLEAPTDIIRPIINGDDVLGTPRRCRVIDFYGFTQNQAMLYAPEAYQQLLDKVKPIRDANRRVTRRERWWLFGEVMPQLRILLQDLTWYVGTPETAKHRIFLKLSKEVLPEHPFIAIGLDDMLYLGVLSSHIHVVWALAAGSDRGETPRYNKSRCFDTFPFPACTEKQKQKIRQIAEELDAHRKRQQQKYPDLTLTDMYNVLEKLYSIDAGTLSPAAFSPKDKQIHDRGLIAILKQLHSDLDAAVLDAYDFPHDLTNDQLLERLVALNHQRAKEEATGLIRYLRPEFQKP